MNGSNRQWYTTSSNQRSIVEVEDQLVNTLSCSGCPSYAFIGQYGGNSYFYTNNTSSWDQAQGYASQAGGHLFVPDTQAEHDYVVNPSQNLPGNNYWIGVSHNPVDSAYGVDWYPVYGPNTEIDHGKEILAKPTIEPGEKVELSVEYTITQQDVNAGSVSNSVYLIAATHNVSDTSDDGDDTDGNTLDDPTVTILDTQRQIELSKTTSITDNGDGVLGVGDVIVYSI